MGQMSLRADCCVGSDVAQDGCCDTTTYLPELGTDLVTTLASLHMNDLTHLAIFVQGVALRTLLVLLEPANSAQGVWRVRCCPDLGANNTPHILVTAKENSH